MHLHVVPLIVLNLVVASQLEQLVAVLLVQVKQVLLQAAHN